MATLTFRDNFSNGTSNGTCSQNTYTLTNPINKNGITQYAFILTQIFYKNLNGNKFDILINSNPALRKIINKSSKSAFNREFAAFRALGLMEYTRSNGWFQTPKLEEYLSSHNLIVKV